MDVMPSASPIVHSCIDRQWPTVPPDGIVLFCSTADTARTKFRKRSRQVVLVRVALTVATTKYEA
eukprot:scaffold318888_cov44-Prasinocladus_malaysianus.AAC.2